MKCHTDRLRDWLTRRNRKKYHYGRRARYDFWIILMATVSIIIFYYALDSSNKIEMWVLGILIVSGISGLYYVYKVLKEINHWHSRQINWVKVLTIVLLLIGILLVYQYNVIDTDRISNYFGQKEIMFDWDAWTTVDKERKEASMAAFSKINFIRNENGRSSLDWDENIYTLAVDRSKDMYERDYFDHVTPEGECANTIKSSYNLDNYYLAENIGAQYTTGGYDYKIDAIQQVDGWMGSRGHRYNLLYEGHIKGAVGCYGGACVFLGGHKDPYGFGSGPCTTGDEGLEYWRTAGIQPGEV